MLACQIDIFVKAVTSNCRLWTFRSKKVKVTPVKSIMIFWNVILVNHLFFVWTETEINVTFHFGRLRQSTRRNIVNINGSSSEWINVWTHFVLEYFITQYLKGFTAQYSTVGIQFLHDHDYLDISLLSQNNIIWKTVT